MEALLVGSSLRTKQSDECLGHEVLPMKVDPTKWCGDAVLQWRSFSRSSYEDTNEQGSGVILPLSHLLNESTFVIKNVQSININNNNNNKNK